MPEICDTQTKIYADFYFLICFTFILCALFSLFPGFWALFVFQIQKFLNALGDWKYKVFLIEWWQDSQIFTVLFTASLHWINPKCTFLWNMFCPYVSVVFLYIYHNQKHESKDQNLMSHKLFEQCYTIGKTFEFKMFSQIIILSKNIWNICFPKLFKPVWIVFYLGFMLSESRDIKETSNYLLSVNLRIPKNEKNFLVWTSILFQHSA